MDSNQAQPPQDSPGTVCMLLEHPFVIDSRVLKEARSLSKAGYVITVIARSEIGLPKREMRSGFEIYRPRRLLGRFNSRLLRPLIVLEFFLVTFLSALRRRADVYHCHSPIMLPQAAFASLLNRSPLIYDAHELSAALVRNRSIRKMIFRLTERLLLWRVSTVIMSDGESRANAFRQIHGYKGQIDYVYNCAELVEDLDTGKDLRKKLGIPVAERVVLYIGAVGPERGLESAIRAVAGCDSPTHLVSMGPVDAAFRLTLQSMTEDLGVRERVHFMSPVSTDEVPVWASTADLAITLIAPYSLSYEYSAPTKMFEALMARIPQVASDFPEIRRVLVDNGVGPAGLLVDPTDDVAVTNAICSLLDNPDLMAELSENAGKLATNYFNWGKQESALLEIYKRLDGGLKSS